MSPSAPNPSLSRRGFLGAAGATATVAALPAATGAAAPARRRTGVFAHAVASGDPLPDGVILWTRVTPTRDATPGSGRGAASELRWEVATDPEFRSIAAAGATSTDAVRDHTVKVDARGLAPRTTYWYRFRVTGGPAAGAVSPTGRTKTAPANDAEVPSVRFGVVSCSNWEAGFFAAYRYLAERELDAIVHLGDYIYEYGAGEYTGKTGAVRTHRPAHDIVSLADYRIRHGQYKTDRDLQAAHLRHPFICTWDDHESADNSWRDGAENHRRSQGPWRTRKANADRAYEEWMPIRPTVSADDRHIYRRLRYGRLLELTMLDLRTYRDQEPGRFSRAADDPSRTITGRHQMRWARDGITTSPTTWQIVGNSVMISPVLLPPLDPARTKALTELIGLPENGVPANPDQWDGYVKDRSLLLGAATGRNVVFLTGDIHMSWANEIPRRPADYPGAGVIATEFVATSVTSNNLDDMTKVPEGTLGVAAAEAIRATNRHTRWVDTDAHGYSIFTVTSRTAQMDWFFLADRADRATPQRHGQSWMVRAGSPHLIKRETPA